MTEEEILRKAYFVLGLEPGVSLEAVNRRHKRLILVWHPDRFPTKESKSDAEDELKKINDARDKLKAHFERGHKASDACACKPSAGGSSESSNQASGRTHEGSGKGREAQEINREEAEVRRKSQERARKAAEEASERGYQKQATDSTAASKRTVKEIVDQEKLLEDERLRWKIAQCIGIAWLVLSLFGFIGTSVKARWHDASWKRQQDYLPRPYFNTGGSNSTDGFNRTNGTSSYHP